MYCRRGERMQYSGNQSVGNEQPSGSRDTRIYYRRLKRRIQIALLIAFLVPLILLSIYFHIQFDFTLKKSSKQHLVNLAQSQRNTIDLFLEERVVNIFNLFRRRDFTLTPTEDDMRRYLEHLTAMSQAFVDVNFLDVSGAQLGYAGPFKEELRGRSYGREKWFQTLMEQDQSYHISDIYLGFRNKPHFTIAVKQVFEGRPYVMRATLDPDKFYTYLQSQKQDQSVDVYIVNGAGKYQVVSPDEGPHLGDSGFIPPVKNSYGAREIRDHGAHGQELVAHAWLSELSWALVVRQPLDVAYAHMYRTRMIMIVGTVVMALILFAATLITTTRLLDRAQTMEETKTELQSQLLHAAKLVSLGELAAGVAHEINNPLAIISAECGVVRDMLDPQFKLEADPASIRRELTVIDEAVYRARDITQKLLTFSRKNEPRLQSCHVNRLLDDVVSGLVEREFLVDDITFERDYDENLPAVRVDPDQMRQVFLNFVANAGDAIGQGGVITLRTELGEDATVRATIQDTGGGMTSEQMQKIFMPFFTTKEVGKGTGLGLSVSLSIVESMNGRIEVQSIPGAGSSFTVVLPAIESEEKQDV